MQLRKAERLPTLGSREEIEGGVESLPALKVLVMTAAIIRKFLLVIDSTQRATTINFCACRSVRCVVHYI